MKNNLIGICGVARSGKDSFYTMSRFILGPSVERFAFADALKNRINDFCKNSLGISAFTHDSQEKDIIRPLLVGLGQAMRKKDPNFWIKQIEPSIIYSLGKGDIVFVTDVRYKNEIDWIHSLGGRSVYISREGTLPANHEEIKNDVFVKKFSQYKFYSENYDNEKMFFEKTYPKVEGILEELVNV